VCLLVFIRFVYYKSKKMHYYLLDFCYYANALILLFIHVFPKSEMLFKTIFCYANGNMIISLAAFRNSLVFHKIDNLTSMAIHLLPSITTFVIRWTTIPYEDELEKKDPNYERYFLSLKEDKFGLQFIY